MRQPSSSLAQLYMQAIRRFAAVPCRPQAHAAVSMCMRTVNVVQQRLLHVCEHLATKRFHGAALKVNECVREPSR